MGFFAAVVLVAVAISRPHWLIWGFIAACLAFVVYAGQPAPPRRADGLTPGTFEAIMADKIAYQRAYTAYLQRVEAAEAAARDKSRPNPFRAGVDRPR